MAKKVPIVGSNDDDGTVRCSLCDWTYKCRSLEEIEMRFAQHLKRVHNRRLKYRVDSETRRRSEIPEVDP